MTFHVAEEFSRTNESRQERLSCTLLSLRINSELFNIVWKDRWPNPCLIWYNFTCYLPAMWNDRNLHQCGSCTSLKRTWAGRTKTDMIKFKFLYNRGFRENHKMVINVYITAKRNFRKYLFLELTESTNAYSPKCSFWMLPEKSWCYGDMIRQNTYLFCYTGYLH